MTYSILFVVEKPSDLGNPEIYQQWDRYNNKIAGIATQYKSLKVLGENVLLLTLQNSLTPLRGLLNAIDDMGYKYTLFDTEILLHEVKAGS